MTNAIELHQWIADYNWDDGVTPLWPVAESDDTDFATALMIYWRLYGPWFVSPEGEINDEARHLRDDALKKLYVAVAGYAYRDPNMMEAKAERVPCRVCGRMILATTARKYDGKCRQCHPQRIGVERTDDSGTHVHPEMASRSFARIPLVPSRRQGGRFLLRGVALSLGIDADHRRQPCEGQRYQG